ncbi:MAG TPA: hypothetical protein VGP65_07175 [Candidatus Angelobacter sp.]|jgi:hypothetical protein|nr:hypothetical protein [Candidatus Angelobacter sp.]
MDPMEFPILILVSSFVVLFLAAEAGNFLRIKIRPLNEYEREDFGVVLGATLTLLGLLIGFSFSMAINRYDQRKLYEEAEANAIGTEYLRVGLLSENTLKVRELLKAYLDQRILFYTTRHEEGLVKISTDTAMLQNELWSAVQSRRAEPTAVVVLAVTGMNDVLNSQGYTQAAWWNRIPVAAWALMLIIAICCNALIGYAAHRTGWRLFMILPVTVAIAFFLIADLDSPRGGTIRIVPQNLLALAHTLSPP